jgi:signal transduction histidine kinase
MSKKKNFIPNKKPNLATFDNKINNLRKEIEQLKLESFHRGQAYENFATLLINFASHDIKNSIHSLDGIISTISIEAITSQDIENMRLCLDNIRTTLDQFSLINTESKHSEFPISSIFQRLDILYRSRLKISNIKFSVKYIGFEKDFIVKQDLNMLTHMFNNLLINSLGALEKIQNGQIEISFELLDDKLKVLFCDNGIGIHDGIKNQIFQKYFTTKPNGQGVGLTHVKWVIETINKGKVSLIDDENANYNTIFQIILPLIKS